MITAKGLSKQFKIYRKPPGFLGSVRSLFYRQYEANHAIRTFDVEIQPGEIIGFLGPNGAGKTTLMKMFTGIIVPSSGSLRVLGYEPAKRDRLFRKKIALVMGQKSQLWWDLPPMDSLQLLQRYYEIEDQDFQKRVHELSELLQVQHILHIHVRKLSLGERMKVELMASLLHKPEVIFLDEPTIGLDIIAQRNIREFLDSYHQQTRTTILLTSHYMADVQALCSRLILILNGQKRFDGALREFEKLLGQEKEVSFTFSETITPEEDFWQKYDPHWNTDRTQVDLRVPESAVREVSVHILQKYPVMEFGTEKMPIERVLKTLLDNPQLMEKI